MDMAKISKDSTQVSVVIPNAVHSQLLEVAIAKDWSVSQTIRNILIEWVESNPTQPPSKAVAKSKREPRKA